MANDESTAFHRLGQAISISLIGGKNPNSIIFRIDIRHEEDKPPYTIEYFAEPDMAMVLLKMLEEVRRREGYQIPEGAITKQRFQ